MSSVTGFWRSACALMQVADQHGGADFGTRSMIHTIGVSFTLEMALKAAYEETLGRVTASWRGDEKTPQDEAVAGMAARYAAFLRQTPWYQYPFRREAERLWAAPIEGSVRGWERRIGIGAEWYAKAAYARLSGAAVAATEPATLSIRSVVAGIGRPALALIDGVKIIGERAGCVEIETRRYARFTAILWEIASRGGTVLDIAGNDDIMVSMTVPQGADVRRLPGSVILRMTRSGIPGERLLIATKVKELAALLRAHPPGDPGLEHVFDY
jgi:hypothetical protein